MDCIHVIQSVPSGRSCRYTQIKDESMRRRTWRNLLLVAGLGLLIVPSVGRAQVPHPFGPAGAPQFMPYGGSGGPIASQQAMLMPQDLGYSPISHTSQIPPQASPYPAISPYENSFAETYNKDGLWFLNLNKDGRKPYFIADATAKRFRIPNRVWIGDEVVAERFRTTGFSGGFFLPASLGVVDDEVIGGDPSVFNVAQQQDQDPTSLGMELTFGHWDPDGTGVNVTGFWQSDTARVFKRGLDAPGSNIVELANSARVTAGLPLANSNLGSVVRYDQLYRIIYDSEAMGGEVNRTLRTIWSSGTLKVKPVIGIRYMFIRERFTFQGRDSGLTITFNNDGSSDPTTATANVTPYSSELNSSVRTHLAGPQIGLHYELGGDFLKVIGTSNFSLMAAHEKIELEGFGIGDPVNDPNFDPRRAFDRKEKNVHVSPMLEQGVTVEANIIQYVPVLGRMKIFEEARFRAGYTITALWEVARPGDTIDWIGQPGVPNVRTRRSKWYMHGWNFGFVWDY